MTLVALGAAETAKQRCPASFHRRGQAGVFHQPPLDMIDRQRIQMGHCDRPVLPKTEDRFLTRLSRGVCG
jgi:hypothetical protein